MEEKFLVTSHGDRSACWEGGEDNEMLILKVCWDVWLWSSQGVSSVWFPPNSQSSVWLLKVFLFSIFRSSPAYGELEERLELLESSMTPVSPHLEERMELLESLISREEEEEQSRHNKRSAEQVCWVLRNTPPVNGDYEGEVSKWSLILLLESSIV